MKKKFYFFAVVGILLFVLSACKKQYELIDMKSAVVDETWCVFWEDRTYVPFCVVSKNDRGEQIGYVDGDEENCISEYKGYSSDEWLVSWMPSDGGAMLLKEEKVENIPDGLEAEYQ